LFQCAGDELGDSLLKANPYVASDTLPQLLAAMCSLGVIPVAIGILCTELLQLHQNHDEPFRTFTARVRKLLFNENSQYLQLKIYKTSNYTNKQQQQQQKTHRKLTN